MKNHLNMFQTSSDYEMFEKDYTQNIKPNVSLITDKDTCVFNSDYEAVIHATFNATANNKDAIYVPTGIKTLLVDGTPVKFKEPHYEHIEVNMLASKINTNGTGSYPSNYIQYNDKFTITPLDSSINILDEDICIDLLLGTQEGVLIYDNHNTIAQAMDWGYCTYDEKNNSLTFEYLNVNTGFDNPGIIKTSAIFLKKTPSGSIQYLDTKCVFNAIIDGMLSPYKFDTEGEHTVEMTLINNLSPCAFKMSCLTHITMDGIKKINENTFQYCSQLQTINFSDNLKVIDNDAFQGCTSLTSITIPDSVTSIGDGAFNQCTSLTSIDLGRGLKDIGGNAFCGCSSLSSVKLSKNLRTIKNDAFSSCPHLTNIKIPNWVTSVSGGAFDFWSNLKSINGTHIMQTEDYIIVNKELVTFNPTSTITNFTIPEDVTSISDEAFFNCDSLTSITIPDSVTSIGDSAFYECRSLTSIIIPEGVTSISNYAFQYCTSLTSITIPDNVSEIGNYTFYGCTSLTSVYCKPITPPTGDSDMFKNNASARKIYVPMASVDTYKAAQYWSTYANAIEGYNF